MWTWWLLDLCHGQGVITVVIAAAATTAAATATRVTHTAAYWIYWSQGGRVD